MGKFIGTKWGTGKTTAELDKLIFLLEDALRLSSILGGDTEDMEENSGSKSHLDTRMIANYRPGVTREIVDTLSLIAYKHDLTKLNDDAFRFLNPDDFGLGKTEAYFKYKFLCGVLGYQEAIHSSLNLTMLVQQLEDGFLREYDEGHYVDASLRDLRINADALIILANYDGVPVSSMADAYFIVVLPNLYKILISKEFQEKKWDSDMQISQYLCQTLGETIDPMCPYDAAVHYMLQLRTLSLLKKRKLRLMGSPYLRVLEGAVKLPAVVDYTINSTNIKKVSNITEVFEAKDLGLVYQYIHEPSKAKSEEKLYQQFNEICKEFDKHNSSTEIFALPANLIDKILVAMKQEHVVTRSTAGIYTGDDDVSHVIVGEMVPIGLIDGQFTALQTNNLKGEITILTYSDLLETTKVKSDAGKEFSIITLTPNKAWDKFVTNCEIYDCDHPLNDQTRDGIRQFQKIYDLYRSKPIAGSLDTRRETEVAVKDGDHLSNNIETDISSNVGRVYKGLIQKITSLEDRVSYSQNGEVYVEYINLRAIVFSFEGFYFVDAISALPYILGGNAGAGGLSGEFLEILQYSIKSRSRLNYSPRVGERGDALDGVDLSGYLDGHLWFHKGANAGNENWIVDKTWIETSRTSPFGRFVPHVNSYFTQEKKLITFSQHLVRVGDELCSYSGYENDRSEKNTNIRRYLQDNYGIRTFASVIESNCIPSTTDKIDVIEGQPDIMAHINNQNYVISPENRFAGPFSWGTIALIGMVDDDWTCMTMADPGISVSSRHGPDSDSVKANKGGLFSDVVLGSDRERNLARNKYSRFSDIVAVSEERKD